MGAGGSLREENEDEAHQSKIFLFTSWFVVRYRLSGPLGKNLGPHLDLLRERGGVEGSCSSRHFLYQVHYGEQGKK